MKLKLHILLSLFALLFFVQINKAIDQKPYNIGLCITATGKYIKFVQPLIESARKFFCTEHKVTFFVFTDGELAAAPDVVKVYQQRLGWPLDTLKRFSFYDSAKDSLESMDYIFALDADMLFVAQVGDEILSNRVATQHPGFVGVRGSYETNSKSTAYVSRREGCYYFAGGFYGGATFEFLKLVQTCNEQINKDLTHDYIAVWHDESHLNRYFIDHIPSLILSPSYCYPENWNLPYVKKLLALDKNHEEMRRSVELDETEEPIVIVIPSYNNKDWLEANLLSIFSQSYHNYRVIYIDDCSSDHTGDFVEEFVKKMHQESRVTLIRNTERRGALANLYNAICSCDDEDIVVTVDGDDWLYHTNVLQQLNELYSSRQVWLTHGKFIEYPSGLVIWSETVPDEFIQRNAFREYKCPSHLRTFKAWLFKQINLEDLLDADRNFFQMTWDQAMMFPMLEMAGEKHVYINDINYVYNVANCLNDNKVNAQLQRDLEKVIRNKKRYQRLEARP